MKHHPKLYSTSNRCSLPTCLQSSTIEGIHIPYAWHLTTSSSILNAGLLQEYVIVSPIMNTDEEVIGTDVVASIGAAGGIVQTENEQG